MYDEPHLVRAIHQERLDRLRGTRNPRRGRSDDSGRTTRPRPGSDRER